MKRVLTLIVLASLFASTAIAESKPTVVKKRTTEELLQTCILCHGTTGNTKDATAPDANNPNLGGQHRDYLLISMQRYLSGERDNAVMKSMLAGFTEEELDRIAKHYAKQKGVWDTATPKFK